MPETIDNYKPRKLSESLRKRAFLFWTAALLAAGIWVAAFVLTPVAAANGMDGFAAPAYDLFGYVCHQLPSRSFHLLGHKFAVCSRCTGVYFGLLLGLLAYPLFRRIDETEPLPRFWLILAMIPMAVDFSLTFFGIWENTHLTRVTSGLILGAACAVFIVPALAELAEILVRKRLERQEKRPPV